MIDHEHLDAYCLSLPQAEASSPFGPQTVVYKVAGKMFALLSLDVPRVNVKCDPEHAVTLRERHESVEPGYHMSKRHWNSVYWEREALDVATVHAWIADSYALVVASLPKRVRESLRDVDA